ncbi:MAG TPA: transglutaminase-like domain-containing protein [candidate division Zixibacteria bacterium]|nr:transglutaminase-like domain-containing protein [candidate division Zixibacteria bacterium]
MRSTGLIFVVAAIVLLGSVAFSDSLEEALEKAGDNRAELEQVLDHYRSLGDSLKLEAAEFLISNMDGHCYVTYYLHDTSGTEVDLDPLTFPTYDSLEAYCNTIESKRGELDYARKEKFDDLEQIKADFLIEHIDLAFKAWRNRPWASTYSWEIFRDFVLPYRGSNEPLESWRPPFMKMFDTLASAMQDSTDPVEAAALINNDIRSWFKFDPRYYFHPTDQGLSEMMESKLGRCEDMTNLTIFALRANGIPVTSDYTPHWATTGNNHAWNAIVLPSGEVVPFMGAEANPGEYNLAHKLAKAYRKMYAAQPEDLVFVDQPQEELPRWLAGKNYKDVTADYVEARQVIVSFPEPVPDSVGIAYLCVFNSGSWRPIDWARIERLTDATVAVFKDVGPDVILLPVLYLNEEVVPAGPPLVPHSAGIDMFIADTDSLTTVTLKNITERSWVASTRGAEEKPLEDSVEYELFYWQDDWQPLGTQTAYEGRVQFDNVPEGALLWLRKKESDKSERIFTIDRTTGRQVWW